MKKYTVKNIYGIGKESSHKSAELALRAKSQRAGSGWIVEDSNGNRWDKNFDGTPAISEYAENL
ncbi:MAG: hypothetical protein PHV82_12070 [Victivallaceae bacterium]|nr:hypothetical protein [Victivallaceae bacterium]